MREFISTAEILKSGRRRTSGRVKGGVRGELLGEFRIIREVGRGGMGVVYLAEQLSLRRHVALKVLPAHLTLRADTVERFRREASTAASLRHPAIVEIHSVGEQGGTHYFAMAFVEGTALDRIIEHLRGQPLDRLTGETIGAAVSHHMQLNQSDVAQRREERPRPARAALPVWKKTYIETVCRLIVQIADALDHAHEAGVIHRDVKPSNILVREDGTAVLTDFGLAREQGLPSITLTGEFAGTPDYVSPEQAIARRGGIDHRTDIYSLGVTLFELLTLRRPFEGHSSQEILQKISSKEPPPPRRFNPLIPRDLQTIVLKAIEKDPARRYPSMAAFAADLRALLEYRPIAARPASPVTRMFKLAKRHRGSVTAGALLLVLVTAGLVYQWTLGSFLRVQCDVAEAVIWIDGREARRLGATVTEVVVRVPPGTHTVRAVHGLDASAPMTVTAHRGEPQTLQLTLVSGLGRLVLDSDPSGAAVTVSKDGQEQGKYLTPNNVRLPAGHYEATFELRGFQTKKLLVEVPDAGREVRLPCSWDTGELVLQGLQEGIQVQVLARDGNDRVIQQLTLPSDAPIRLPVGQYRVVGRMRNHDWREYDDIEVIKGRRTVAALWLPPITESAPLGSTPLTEDTFLIDDLEGDGIPEIIVAQPSGAIRIYDSRGVAKAEGSLVTGKDQTITRLITADLEGDHRRELIAGTSKGAVVAYDHHLTPRFTRSALGAWSVQDIVPMEQGTSRALTALLKEANSSLDTPASRFFQVPILEDEAAATLAAGQRAFAHATRVASGGDHQDAMIAWSNEQLGAFQIGGELLWDYEASPGTKISAVLASDTSAPGEAGVVALITDLRFSWPRILVGWTHQGERLFEQHLDFGITAETLLAGGGPHSTARIVVATDRASLVGLDDRGRVLFEVATPGLVRDLVTADLDGNHSPQIVAATYEGRVAVYRGDGIPRCELDSMARLVLPRDLNGDGRDELVVMTNTSELKVFEVGNATLFVAPVPETLRLTSIDLDEDARAEITLSDSLGDLIVLARDGAQLLRTMTPVPRGLPVHVPLHADVVEFMAGTLTDHRVYRVTTDGAQQVLDLKNQNIVLLTRVPFSSDGLELLGVGTADGRALVVNADGEILFDRYVSDLGGDPRRYQVTAMSVVDLDAGERCLVVGTRRGQVTSFKADRSIQFQIELAGNAPVGSLTSVHSGERSSGVLAVTDPGGAQLLDALGGRHAIAAEGAVVSSYVADLDRDGQDEIILLSQSTRADTTWRSQLSVCSADGRLRSQHDVGVTVRNFFVFDTSPDAATIVLQTDDELIALDAAGQIRQRESFPGAFVTAVLAADLDGDRQTEWIVGTASAASRYATMIVHQDGSRRLLSNHSYPVELELDDPRAPRVICYDDAGHLETIRFDPQDPRRTAEREFLAALASAERGEEAVAREQFGHAGLRWLALDDSRLAVIRAPPARARCSRQDDGGAPERGAAARRRRVARRGERSGAHGPGQRCRGDRRPVPAGEPAHRAGAEAEQPRLVVRRAALARS
ncbi:MAG: serine/threonine-protein kinase [Planctomycetota bacterium]